MEQIVLTCGAYIQICVADEQKQFTRSLVEYAIRHHHISNIWDKDASLSAQTRLLRFTGTLGEVVFADCYHLPRPERSFGAADGQDWGQDFLIDAAGHSFAVDVKSMKRKSGQLASDYVLNIASSQLNKPGSRTSHYFCISFHQSETEGTVASLLGFIDKDFLNAGILGTLFRAGSTRVRSDGSSFTFPRDTYEVLFKDIDPPVVTESMKKLKGFRICYLK
jgi:hypothetical protein